MQWGKGTYDPLNRSASNVYGLAGEAMLNFGMYGVPVAFLIWTLIVGRGRKWILCLEPGDVRRLLSPLLALLCFLILNSDSDNIFYTTVKWGTVPVALLWFSSQHVPLRQVAQRVTGFVPRRTVANAVVPQA
jgi:hypothetical protein